MANEQLDYFDAIEASYTEEVRKDVMRYARWRCRTLSRAGLPADPEELWQAAITSTVDGTRPWNPQQCSLRSHLRGVIRSRSSDAFERGARIRHVHLGATVDEDGYDPVEVEASAHKTERDPESALIDSDRVTQTVRGLLGMAEASNDNQVLRLIGVWCEGVLDADDCAARLGLSKKKYKNARERLMYMAAKLDPELNVRGHFND